MAALSPFNLGKLYKILLTLLIICFGFANFICAPVTLLGLQGNLGFKNLFLVRGTLILCLFGYMSDRVSLSVIFLLLV